MPYYCSFKTRLACIFEVPCFRVGLHEMPLNMVGNLVVPRRVGPVIELPRLNKPVLRKYHVLYLGHSSSRLLGTRYWLRALGHVLVNAVTIVFRVDEFFISYSLKRDEMHRCYKMHVHGINVNQETRISSMIVECPPVPASESKPHQHDSATLF